MHRASFRSVLTAHDPLILIGAHDGLSARLIEQAGYPAFFIGGFPLVGARYGVPDIGIKGLGEIAAGVRDILGATGLPVLVDGDDGYGDVKNVAHTVRTYEDMGAGADHDRGPDLAQALRPHGGQEMSSTPPSWSTRCRPRSTQGGMPTP